MGIRETVRTTVCILACLVAFACASAPPGGAGPAPVFDLEATLAKSKALIAALDFEGALAQAETAVKAASGNVQVWRQFAAALGYSGDVARALEAYAKALDLAPGDPRILNARAMFLAKAGRPTEALADTESALATPTASSNGNLKAAILDTKAWALFLAGDYAGARSTEKQAATLSSAVAGYAPILEFRLTAAERGATAARDFAERALAAGDLPAFAVQALEIMTGKKDIRDMVYESAFAVSDFSLYITGFTFAPAASPLVPASPSGIAVPSVEAPVVLVTEPQATATDDSTIAIAKLAFRDGLTKAGVFSVVDSDSRKAAFKELELNLSGMTAGDRDVAVGSLFSADFVASGSIARMDAGWLMAYTFSDAVTGRILASDMTIARDATAIMDLAARFSVGLADMVRDGRIPTPGAKE